MFVKIGEQLRLRLRLLFESMDMVNVLAGHSAAPVAEKAAEIVALMTAIRRRAMA